MIKPQFHYGMILPASFNPVACMCVLSVSQPPSLRHQGFHYPYVAAHEPSAVQSHHVQQICMLIVPSNLCCSLVMCAALAACCLFAAGQGLTLCWRSRQQ
jgi:hypothetical protein